MAIMNFLYEAVDENGLPVFGKIDAFNETEAHQQLQERGLRAQSLATSGGSVAAAAAPQIAQAYRENQTEMFSSQMGTGIGTIVAMPPSGAPSGVRHAVGVETVGRSANITMAGNAARLAPRPAPKNPIADPVRLTASTVPGSTLGGIGTRDMMMLFRQLSSLVHSGMSIYGALENLMLRTPNKNLAKTVGEMAQQARSGGSIAEVMAHYPRIYPEHITATVRAGELGGFVEIALGEIAVIYEQNIALYRYAWIPKIMAGLTFFALPFVLPLFPTLFSSMDFSANAALYLKWVLFCTLPASLALVALGKYMGRVLQLPQHRYRRDSWSLKMPAFGELQRQVAISTFLRMMGRLYHAGVSPIAAWEGAMNTASNVVIRDCLGQSYTLMQQGASLPDAFAATGLFANEVEQLIFTGHQSGQVVEMLDQAEGYYKEKVDQANGKAKFMIFRLGLLTMLVCGGGAMCYMAYTYFHGMFSWVDKFFGTD